VRIDGRDTLATTVDPSTIESVVDLGVRHGSLRDFGPDQVAVSVDYAEEHSLALGDPVTGRLPGRRDRAADGLANEGFTTLATAYPSKLT
jgi:hypothetical protein